MDDEPLLSAEVGAGGGGGSPLDFCRFVDSSGSFLAVTIVASLDNVLSKWAADAASVVVAVAVVVSLSIGSLSRCWCCCG